MHENLASCLFVCLNVSVSSPTSTFLDTHNAYQLHVGNICELRKSSMRDLKLAHVVSTCLEQLLLWGPPRKGGKRERDNYL